MPLVLFDKITDERASVNLIHNMPDDPEHGLPDNIKNKGIYVDSIPENLPIKKGTNQVLYINPLTEEMWYEYVDRPLSPEEVQQEVNEKIDLLLQIQLSAQGVI